jgi:hypothetical protein
LNNNLDTCKKIEASVENKCEIINEILEKYFLMADGKNML